MKNRAPTAMGQRPAWGCVEGVSKVQEMAFFSL